MLTIGSQSIPYSQAWLPQRLSCLVKIATELLVHRVAQDIIVCARSVTINLSWLILQQEMIRYESLDKQL